MTSTTPPVKEPFIRKKRWRPRVRTGCLTCRQRKIKCDEAKPACQRCLATNRECKGYMLTQTAIKPPTPPPFTGSKDLHEVMLYFPRIDECVGASARDPQREIRGKVEVLLRHLPCRTGHSVALDAAVKCVAAGIQDVLTHHAAMGSAVRFAGFYNGKTLGLYTRALGALRVALDDPVQSTAGESLFAALLICCFESFRRGNMETVKSHVIGISKMVQHRGPGRYEDEFDRELLFHHRPVIAIACYLTNTPCFLYDPNWQKINMDVNTASERHQFTSSAEYYLEEVITLSAECSSFMKSPNKVWHETLLQKVESYNKRLNAWRDTWVTKFAGPDSNALSVIETFGKKHSTAWLANSMASYYVFIFLNQRIRVALGCDGVVDVEKKTQNMAKSVRALYQKHKDLPEPFLLPFLAKALVDTKGEWARFSVQAGGSERMAVPAHTFARWLKFTGVYIQDGM